MLPLSLKELIINPYFLKSIRYVNMTKIHRKVLHIVQMIASLKNYWWQTWKLLDMKSHLMLILISKEADQ